ncbi:hypothetical protein POM88_044883 [Heracleum sosnowskyi]|uniref:RNase H type-1 domain-containing protein n=1 Tax=Heracleum sosnowskyi TaxID=360622 RepID=A0AAD8M5L6_9APIA|nr:hypothetical protein POM88_044883 [Heracleum sosnowskyi]
MGPLLSQFQAELRTVHLGIKEAYSRGFNNVMIEAEHVQFFRILKRQDFEEASREDLVNIIQDINAWLVELDYNLISLMNLLDANIGWGPNNPALNVQTNYDRGEVVQGPKPKRHKRVVIEENEFSALLKLTERVAYLENVLDGRLKSL